MYTQRDRLGTISNLSKRVEELSEENARLRKELAHMTTVAAMWEARCGGGQKFADAEALLRDLNAEEPKCE